MTKLIYKILMTSAFSLFVMTQGVNASNDKLIEEMSDIFSRPKISTQGTNTKIVRERQEEEGQLLQKAIDHLLEEDQDRAVELFMEAVSINGSPLGYLYLAAIWNDERYHRIVHGAMKHDFISKRTVFEHAIFLKDQGFTFDLYGDAIASK